MSNRFEPDGKVHLTQVNSQEGLLFWRQSAVDQELRDELQAASILLVPTIGFRDYPGPTFPDGTVSVYKHLEANMGDYDVAVAASDDDYKEVALHSELIVLGKFVIDYIVAPLFTTVLGGYVLQRLKGDANDATVRATIAVDRSTPGETDVVEFSYEGPANVFQSTIADQFQRLSAPTTTQVNSTEHGQKNDPRPSEIAGTSNNQPRLRKSADSNQNSSKKSPRNKSRRRSK